MSKEASIFKTHNFDSTWKLFSSITLNNFCSCSGQNRSSVQSFCWVQQIHSVCVCVSDRFVYECVWWCGSRWKQTDLRWRHEARRVDRSVQRIWSLTQNLVLNVRMRVEDVASWTGSVLHENCDFSPFVFCQTGPSLGRWFWLVFVELCMSVWLVREDTGPCLDPEQNWLYKAVSDVWTWSCYVRAECSAFLVLSQSRIKFLISD